MDSDPVKYPTIQMIIVLKHFEPVWGPPQYPTIQIARIQSA